MKPYFLKRKKDHRDKEYILFCSLKPWFLTNITSFWEGKKEDLLPTTTSAYHYLPLPASFSHSLPATTCHYLPLPATTCHLPATSLPLPPPATCVSTCHYLPLPATTCHYLPLPATACHYLLLPDYQLLPLLAIICHNLSAGPVAEIATTETIQQARMPNNLNRFLLENSFRQRISSSWFVF